MRQDLPPSIYRGLSRIQSEAQSAFLMLSDTFQKLEHMQTQSASDIKQRLPEIESLAAQLLLQWNRFNSAVHEVQSDTRAWTEIALRAQKERTQEQNTYDPIAELLLELAQEEDDEDDLNNMTY